MSSSNRLKRYELAIEGSDICIWDWMDVENKEQWWSPGFYDKLGYQEDEIDANIDNFKSLLHPDDVDKVFGALNDHFNTGEPLSLEYRLQTKSGEYKWFRGSAKATFDADGNPTSVAGSIIDIDDRKEVELKLEKDHNLLRTIIDNIPACVYVKDLDGRKVLANRSEYELWGFDREEQILGKRDADLSKEGIAALSENEDQEVLETGEPIIDKDAYTEIDGKEYVLLVSKLPLKDSNGNIVGLVGISNDITERKKMENKLRERNQQLEKLNNMTNKIYSVVGHDLKTPLSSILGLSDLLLSDIDSEDEEDLKDNLSIIRQSALKMSDLLGDLLNWARIQTGDLSLNKTEFSISETVRDTIDLLAITAEQKGISLQFENEESFQVYADKQLIATIIRNFISNALKFSDEGDTVAVSVHRDEKHWHLSVEDEGVGMSEENIERLFDNRKHPQKEGTQNEKGSGIGLRLCKELAERHGGQISVESELGKGSTFTLSIPINQGSE
ncbi:sensor histidine kinase [Fodinibius sp.]|uniref:sensor histidine kinase n=1 Tax=Fodinibius sp. TaxID=1872440 RepID=UPI002ACE9C8F|nr:ATP-binding protein [Fodinibius sp.]MDZ7659874.1 PAS domain S-box protein [Fodinibius sp.]